VVEARLVITALAIIVAMFLAAMQGLRNRTGIGILGLLSLSWFTVDKLFEGEVLFQINRTQGLTTADFVGLLGLGVAGLLWWRSRKSSFGWIEDGGG
jgi:hypothetical protein